MDQIFIVFRLSLFDIFHDFTIIYRPLGYERVCLPLCKVADTPFHIQGVDICIGITKPTACVHLTFRNGIKGESNSVGENCTNPCPPFMPPWINREFFYFNRGSHNHVALYSPGHILTQKKQETSMLCWLNVGWTSRVCWSPYVWKLS